MMNARAKETLLFSTVVVLSLCFALYAREKVPEQFYRVTVVASTMLLSIFSKWGVGNISNSFGGERWIFANGLAIERRKTAFFPDALIIGALAGLSLIEVRSFENLWLSGISTVISFFVMAVNVMLLPLFTRVLLGSLSVSRYFDSLKTPGETTSMERRSHSIPTISDASGRVARGWKNASVSAFTSLLLGFFVAFVPSRNPAFIAWLGFENRYAFACLVAFLSVFVTGYCFFGVAANLNLALCGLKHEQALLDGSPRDDAMFEVHCMMAQQAKEAAIMFAIVAYPATFYFFYSLMGL